MPSCRYNLHNFPQCYQKVHQLYVIQLFVFQHSLMIFFFIWFNNHSFFKNPDQSDWKSLKLIFNWSSLNCKVSSFSYAIFNSRHFNQLGYHIWVNASSVWFNCHSSLLHAIMIIRKLYVTHKNWQKNLITYFKC